MDKYVEVVEVVGTQWVEAVENLVEVVDNSPYQDLHLKLWKPGEPSETLDIPPLSGRENRAGSADNTICIALDGAGPDMINYTRCMTGGSG